jgi:hypothetical protein
MDNADQKDQPGPTEVEDLERVVTVRKYRHCAAEYLKLAKEPNTMREVADRYLRIAAYYSELADTEDTENTNEGDAKLDQRFRSSNHIRPPCRAYRPRCERRAPD